MSVAGPSSVDGAAVEADTVVRVGEELDALENLAFSMDSAFRIPGTNVRIGVDPLVGLLPGAGDGVMMMLASYIVYRGTRLGAPTGTLLLMSTVLFVEGVVGMIPIVGDAVDFLWSAQRQNVGYLRAHRSDLDGSTNWRFVAIILAPVVLAIYAVLSVIASVLSFLGGIV